MSAARFVRCPQCGCPVEWAATSRWRPFCSARCKTIDLGAWASETYRVPVVESDESDEIPGDASSGGERDEGPARR